METMDHLFPWLELVDRPAFCVKDGVVVAANSAAKSRMLQIGTDIREIVAENRSAYEEFQSGQLYLTIRIADLPCNASVTRTRECDVFLVHQDADDDQLQTLALASQQLRIPLSNVMTVMDQLLSELDDSDPDKQQKSNQINHSLFQLLRIISNMSDTGSYKNFSAAALESVNLTALIDEIVQKAQAYSEETGIAIQYAGLSSPVFGLAHREKLERAIYNLLSNALKFSPSGSTVLITLSKNGDQLSISVCNQNAEDVSDRIFWKRYRREPSIEDNRYGLGLGMTLVSAVAAAHKGTVLIDHPSPTETRVTMTIAIVKNDSGTIRTPVLRIGDYAGGRDKGLLEFAEILPKDAYKKIN